MQTIDGAQTGINTVESCEIMEELVCLLQLTLKQ